MHINFALHFMVLFWALRALFKNSVLEISNAYICNFSANLQSRVKKGKMSQQKCERTLSLLTGVLDYESFKDVDMVIEARQSITLFFFPLFLAFYYK